MQTYGEPRNGEVARLTIPQAAARLGVSPDTIRRKIKDGVLPAVMFAGKYRILISDLEGLMRDAA